MVADAKKNSDPKKFRFSDLTLTLFFVCLGVFLVYAVILLLGLGEVHTLPRQLFGP
jgi:hypothetical protein